MKLHSLFLLAVLVFGFSMPALAEEKLTLWRLEIDGNQHFNDGEILDAITSTPSSHLKSFFSFGKWGQQTFDPIALQADIKRIAHFYKRRGYYQAAVDTTDVKPCSKEGRVCVALHITEGLPTTISRINIKAANSKPQVSSQELLRVFPLHIGQLFDHDQYLTAKKAIIDYLKEKSYPLPQEKGEAVYDSVANQVTIDLEVTPGTAARLGLISFEGLDHILPEDAMARLPIKTGEPYNPYYFDDAADLLSGLDVFRSIDLELKPRKDDPSIVDVLYHVREKQLRSLLFGFGVAVDNSRQELRSRAEWIHRDFHHRLRKLDIRAEPRYAVLPSIFRPRDSGPLGTAEVSMTHPAFLNARQDLTTSIGFDSDLEEAYRWYGPRVSGNLTRKLSRQWSVGGGYSFRYLSFYDVNITANSPVSSQTIPAALLFTKNYRLGFIDQRITWDGRDYPLEPYKGGFAQLQLAESAHPLGSAFTYVQFQPDIRGYLPTPFPLPRHALLAARVAYGYLAPLAGKDSPITERFYQGGSNSHRGFSYHRLSPQVIASDGRTVPIGGDVSFLFSLEERMDMFRIGEHWLIGALFFDAGDVVEGPPDLNLKRLHYAVGPGLRYNTPIGVIRADFGIRLNRLGTETDGQPNPDPGSRFAAHVSFGESF